MLWSLVGKMFNWNFTLNKKKKEMILTKRICFEFNKM